MDYKATIQYIETKKGLNHDLNQYRQWLNEQLPDHTQLPKIQVGGTNGKGSTVAWMNQLLSYQGVKTGVFTSPHLVTHRERIRIGKTMISEDDWMRIYQQYEAFFEKENLTMFEIDLWMAMAYFLEQKVDIALIEVGLGGRLDATTALDYNLVMITNVGLEHCVILGDTIEQISYEKAGIFKPGYVALTTETKPNAKKVMEQVAGYMGTLLGFVEIPFKETDDHQVIFEWQDHTYVLHPPKYQIYNLSLALEGLNYLGYTLKPDCVQSVIDHFHWAGRFTIARKDPLIILDGAHNKEGIEALVASLGHFDGHIYFSVLKDKKAKEMLNVLETLHCPITLVSMDTARLYDLQTLNYPIINEKQLMVELQNTKDHTLVCGSLYFIGDFYKAFTNK